jgi:tetratricopeptide (TPR) repeat protein
MHALALQGIDLTWKQKYAEADSVFLVMTREFPGHPAGYAYRAGVMQTKAVDHELPVDRPKLDSLLDVAKGKAKSMISGGGAEARWGYFYLATSEGCDSYARVYRGDWVGGALRGVASFSAFKDAVEQDSAIFDAYAGIGGFYYWRSRKTEHFNWLPFVGDDRPKAVPLLLKTVENGVYNRFTALSMLVVIYNDAGMYEKAVECAQEGLLRYPSNQVFLWGLTSALQKLGNQRVSIAAFERLLRSLEEERGENRYNELVCQLNIATLRLELGDTSTARQNLAAILKWHLGDFPPALQDRSQAKLVQAKEILVKIGGTLPSNE